MQNMSAWHFVFTAKKHHHIIKKMKQGGIYMAAETPLGVVWEKLTETATKQIFDTANKIVKSKVNDSVIEWPSILRHRRIQIAIH